MHSEIHTGLPPVVGLKGPVCNRPEAATSDTGPVWRRSPTPADPGTGGDLPKAPLAQGACHSKSPAGKCCSQLDGLPTRAVLGADLARSHFPAGRSWARPVTSLCAPISSSLKWGSDRPPIRGLLWDYGSPCVKVLGSARSGVAAWLLATLRPREEHTRFPVFSLWCGAACTLDPSEFPFGFSQG